MFGASITYSYPFNPAAVMGDVFYSDSRAEALTALEQSYGAETYFDADGNCIAQAPTGAEPVVWTVDATGIMVDADEALDRTGIYNGVLVRGQQTGDAAGVGGGLLHHPDVPDPLGQPRSGKVLLVADAGDHDRAGPDDRRTAQAAVETDP